MQGVKNPRSKLPVYSPLPNQIHTTRQKNNHTTRHWSNPSPPCGQNALCAVIQKKIHTYLLIARLLPCIIHAQTRHWSKPRVVDKMYFVVLFMIFSQQMHCQTTPLFNAHNIPMIQSISVWTGSTMWCHSQNFCI